MFSGFDCLISNVRKKKSRYNTIMSGFCVASTLQARHGLKRAAMAGMFGAAFMGVFEAVTMLIAHR